MDSTDRDLEAELAEGRELIERLLRGTAHLRGSPTVLAAKAYLTRHAPRPPGLVEVVEEALRELRGIAPDSAYWAEWKEKARAALDHHAKHPPVDREELVAWVEANAGQCFMDRERLLVKLEGDA